MVLIEESDLIGCEVEMVVFGAKVLESVTVFVKLTMVFWSGIILQGISKLRVDSA